MKSLHETVAAPARRMIGCALLLAAVLVFGGCGGEQAERDTRLVVVGVDSADWNLLDPMIEEGRLPNLAALRAESASGRMLTFRPLTKSPILWASITTGQRPEVHGVGGFVKGHKQAILSSADWLSPGIWDILGAAGRSTAIIGMWGTFPARPINGVMVSDYLPYGGRDKGGRAGLVTPDSLSAAIEKLRISADDVTDEMLTRFITPEALAVVRESQSAELHKLREIWAADLTYHAVAKLLAEGDRFDLFYYYMRGPDMISHQFWNYLEPEKYHITPPQECLDAFSQVVPRYYDWVDEVLGEVLGWFPADRQVVVLSDHGFYGGRVRGNSVVRGTQEHSQYGIYVARSPLYEAGAVFDPIQLLDICPSMLAMLGLPAGEDMPGDVFTGGMTEAGHGVARELETKRVTSYQSLHVAAADSVTGDAVIDEEIREQLRSLGYIK